MFNQVIPANTIKEVNSFYIFYIWIVMFTDIVSGVIALILGDSLGYPYNPTISTHLPILVSSSPNAD